MRRTRPAPTRRLTAPEAEPAAATTTPTPTTTPDLVIEVTGLRRTLTGAVRLFAEAVVVPTVLLMVLLHVIGLHGALATAVSWCLLMVGVRWVGERRVPATLLMCTTMLTGKACISWASSALLVYLLQPVVGSTVMALLFLGSALLGRPITVRLARDFVHVPPHILGRKAVRRMFMQVALVWGLSRVGDVAMSLGFLRIGGQTAGLFSRALLSPALTLVTVVLCASWGWWALRRDGVRLTFGGAQPAPVGA